MARKKKRHGKQKFASKLINAGGILIGLSGLLQVVFEEGFTSRALLRIMNRLTFGLTTGAFDLAAGLKAYVPAGAAVGYRELTKYLMRRFPIR